MPRGQKIGPGPLVAALLCLLGLAVNCVIIGPGGLTIAYRGQNDFRLFYIGGKLAGSGDLYNVNRVLAAQQDAFGESNRRLMPVRLPFYYALLSPLARLPYGLALLLWAAGSILAIAFFVLLSPGGSRIWLAVACFWSLPLVFSVAIGQDLGLMLLVLGGALRMYRAEKRWLAGLILALCLIKFNLFLLLPLLFLGKREWRMASGFCVGTASLLILSFAGVGNWPRSYLALILDPVVSPDPRLMPNLHGLMARLWGHEFVELLLSAMVIALVWRVVRRYGLEVGLGATLLGGLLLTRHAYMQDCAVLIGLLVTLSMRPPSPLVRNCALALLIPLPYLLFFIQGGAATAILMMLLLAAMAWAGAKNEPLPVCAPSR